MAKAGTHEESVTAATGSERRHPRLMGSAPAGVLSVRLDPELRGALAAMAERDGTSPSDVTRAALRRYLGIA
jgi:Ribbon-helix-helix protein, copG family